MKFSKYVELREAWKSPNSGRIVPSTFSTRQPHELNMFADFSDEENDSTYFLKPLAVKIKALGYYCEVSLLELEGSPFNLSGGGRDEQLHGNYRLARITALRGMVGSEDLHNGLSGEHELTESLYTIYRRCQDFVQYYQKYVKDKDIDCVNAMSSSIGRIIKESDNIAKFNSGSVMIIIIKNRIKRASDFLKTASSLFDRIKDINPPSVNAVPYGGRRDE